MIHGYKKTQVKVDLGYKVHSDIQEKKKAGKYTRKKNTTDRKNTRKENTKRHDNTKRQQSWRPSEKRRLKDAREHKKWWIRQKD
jgi:hypothetical protein